MRIALVHTGLQPHAVTTVAQILSPGGHELRALEYGSAALTEALRWADGVVLIVNQDTAEVEATYREALSMDRPCGILPKLDGVRIHGFVLQLKAEAERARRVGVQRRAG